MTQTGRNKQDRIPGRRRPRRLHESFLAFHYFSPSFSLYIKPWIFFFFFFTFLLLSITLLAVTLSLLGGGGGEGEGGKGDWNVQLPFFGRRSHSRKSNDKRQAIEHPTTHVTISPLRSIQGLCRLGRTGIKDNSIFSL